MKILVDFRLSAEDELLLLGPNVTYRPDLANRSVGARRATLLELRPDVLISRQPPEEKQLLNAWRECLPANATPIFIHLGRSSPSRFLHGVRCYGLPATADTSAINAFLLAERIGTNTLETWLNIPTSSPVTEKRSSVHVALIGAGIVNLVTAYYLSRAGYRLDIYDAGSDPITTSTRTASCTFGGEDARVFSLNESRHHHYRGLSSDVKTRTVFRRDIFNDGWLCRYPESLTTADDAWIREFEATPAWLAQQFDADIISFNRESFPLWREMLARSPHLFDDVGFHNRLLRLYQTESRFLHALTKEHDIGAMLRKLPLTELAYLLPALADAVQAKQIAGAMEVIGFSVNVHKFARRLIAELSRDGARFHWNRRATGVARDHNGTIHGIHIGNERIEADHYVVSPGAFGIELLKGLHTQNKIAAMIGMWLTLPNTEPMLDCPLKISRKGFAADESAEGANVIPGVNAVGDQVIYMSSGHGFLGIDPHNLDPTYLSGLHRAVEETAARLFPRPYEIARKRGWLSEPTSYCVRPWTPSGLGIFEAHDTVRGKFIVTGGHSTGGFAQSPSIAHAVLAAMQGMPHAMHRLYHPHRLSRFLAITEPDTGTSRTSPSSHAVKPLRIAIVGMGAWGLCVFDRIIAHAAMLPKRQIVVHIIDPCSPGPGVHTEEQPDYLLLNTVGGQVCIFGERALHARGDRESAPTLCEWAHREGFRIDDATLDVTRERGREISPHDFLPRRLLGSYLRFAYERMTTSAPDHVRIEHHAALATGLRRTITGNERLTLDSGEQFDVDHVFLTTGHTANVLSSIGQRAAPPYLPPYPTDTFQSLIEPDMTVAVSGMGLVAVDVITALTIGRGGRHGFDPALGRERYYPSGREPHLLLFSRHGLPFHCRPAVSADATGNYRPVVFTADVVTAMRRSKQENGGLDFMCDLWPLLRTEMRIMYYLTHTAMVQGEAATEHARIEIEAAWYNGEIEQRLHALALRYGPFDPDAVVFGPSDWQRMDSSIYQRTVYDILTADIAESTKGEARSPLKSALELFRVLRDNLRLAVDFGGLSPSSADDFRTRIASQINRVVVGPPLRRGKELLALIDAGIVEIPFGPSPRLAYDADQRHWQISSMELKTLTTRTVDIVIAGHLEQPGVDRSTSPLLAGLLKEGRVRAGTGGGVEVCRDNHPLNRTGVPESKVWILGPLTEGTKYFNHYVPSPKSRSRAFEEADRCVRVILDNSAAEPIGFPTSLSNTSAFTTTITGKPGNR